MILQIYESFQKRLNHISVKYIVVETFWLVFAQILAFFFALIGAELFRLNLTDTISVLVFGFVGVAFINIFVYRLIFKIEIIQSLVSIGLATVLVFILLGELLRAGTDLLFLMPCLIGLIFSTALKKSIALLCKSNKK